MGCGCNKGRSSRERKNISPKRIVRKNKTAPKVKPKKKTNGPRNPIPRKMK
jgi:hypothetical protein